jgi:cytochrome c5
MNKVTIALALGLAAALSGCGRNSDNAATGASNGTAASQPSTAQSTPSGSDSTASTASATPPAGQGAATGSSGGTPAMASTTPAAGDSHSSSAPGSLAGADVAGSGASNTAAMGAAPASGQAVFAQTCQVCHGAGVAGAPKLGDKADWKPRIAQGKNVLYQHAIQGFTGKKGMMPPKGGNTALADADVKSAVDYMVAQGQ